MVYLIVGLDRDTLARWHAHVQADDATSAERIASRRAARQGVTLAVAAAIGPYSSIAEDVRVEPGMPQAA